MLVASIVSNLRAQSGIAHGVDAIVEECAAAAYECGEKGSLQDNLSPRQGRRNTAECVSLKFRQVACAFGVGKFAHQYRKYRNLFPGEGRKSLPRVHAAANLLVNQHLSLHGIGEALAPSCILSWGRPITRQIP